ncbi:MULTISPECIES: energy transducer TonB [unclassified Sulfuricurvum]|uniref:energy transducer TonB n=1 Tax=unclassified Sulfuricurvum TaxID=2632390 RepID=UPI0002995C95|nr:MULTISPECIES: TonB family protein [unclassified Sulfuricurvum]AFV97875.1 hypothetical protein B649_07815 [Candidatus Sulfuricurvum sp. RIFRC-1]HBM35580.1 energy transducer TonB [Sulfuricurvum sp.]
MKTKRSFLLSIVLHAGIITGAVALSTLPKEEKEEEIVLELALKESSPANQVQPIVKSTLPIPQKIEPVEAKPIVPRIPEPIVKAQEPEPKVQEVVVPSQPVAVAQVAQPEPKIIPVVKLMPVTPPVNMEEQYLDDHLSTIRELLVKYRKYPSQAVRLKQEGAVKVTFRLKQNGDVEDIRIMGSSGYELLDDDAMALVQKVSEYFPQPPQTVRITVPLNYALKVRT